MPLTNNEAVDMIAIYFECFQNAAIAARQYAARYPDRRHYGRRMFPRLVQRLRDTGSFRRPKRRRRRNGRTEENIINVLAYIEFDRHVGTRTLSLDLGIARTTVRNILKDYRLHPYHIVLHQALNEQDFDNRLNYCQWMLGMLEENRNFLTEILWTDEATFSSDGRVNRHNMHYWSAENPHWLREVQHQGRWSLNVWCGIIGDRIIGPYFFDQALTGNRFLEFLINDLPILLEDVPLETRRTMFLQLDGCPAHYSINVRNHINGTFRERWIGRGSLFPWPARSPDLTCLDFYLWGRLKDIVFQTPPTTRMDMENRIRNSIRQLSAAEIEAAVLSTQERLEQCVEYDGRQFEHRRH